MSETTDLIKRLRERGLSQSDISRRTGILQPRLSRWEGGDTPAGADDALKLAALERELLGADDLPPGRQASDPDDATAIAAASASCGSQVLPQDWDLYPQGGADLDEPAPAAHEPAASAMLLGGRREDDHPANYAAVGSNGHTLAAEIDAVGRLVGDTPRRGVA